MVTQFLIGQLARRRTGSQDSHEGQGLVEYALLILFISIAAFAAVGGMGDTVRDVLYGKIVNELIPMMGG